MNRSFRRRIIFWVFILLFPLQWGAPPSIAADLPSRRVLILNSYHPGMTFSDEEVRGIRSTLPGSTEVHIEYMDAKRIASSEHRGLLAKTWKLKYAATRFDLVFSLDDDALRFLLRHHREIFPGTPVVFCGVNDLRDGMLKNQPWFTGVIETIDIEPTIALGLKLRPSARRVLAITDNTTSGRINREALERLARSGRLGAEIVFLDVGYGLAVSELLLKLQAAPKDSIVYYSDFFQDRAGNTVNLETLMPLVSAAAPGPVLVHGAIYLGHGAVGGKLNSGFYQGQTAGRLARRIWAGEKPSDIPVVLEDVNRYMFDHRELKRWEIPASALPPGSDVLYREVSFYQQYHSWIWGITGFVLFQATIIVCLAVNILKRRRAERSLRESEALFRAQFEFGNIGSALTSVEKGWLRVNPCLCEMLGYTEQELLRKTWAEMTYPDDLAYDEVLFNRMLAGEIDTYETDKRFYRKDGSVIFTHMNAACYRNPDRSVRFIIASLQDISEKKRMELALQQSAEHYRSILQSSFDIILVLDKEGHVTYESPSAADVLGYEPGYFIGRSPFEVVHPGDVAFLTRRLDAVRAMDQHGVPSPFRCRKADGSWVQMEAIGRNQFENPGIRGIVITARDVTERKRAEQSLRQSERRLSLAISATSDAVWEWNLLTDETYYSPRWYEMLGYSDQQFPMTFDAWRELCHPEDIQPTVDRIQDVLNSPVSNGYIAEFRMRSREGSWVWILGRGNVVERDAAGRPVLLSGTNTDITARKQAEAELERTRALLEAAISASPAGILIADAPDVRIRVVNEAGLLIRGQSDKPLVDIPAELHPANWQVLHPDRTPFRPEELPLSRAVLKGERVVNQVAIIRDSNGVDHWVLANASPIRNAEGAVTGGIVVFPDITALKRTEEALIDSEARLRAIIDSAPDAIFIRDRQNHYLLVNKAFPKVFNLSEDSIIGRTFDEMFDDLSTARVREENEKILAGEIVEVEVERIVNGNPRIFNMIKAPLRNRLGEIIGICGIGRDITDRRNLETQLFQSQKMEAIGTLAGGIAHDFNNILTAIIGFSELSIEEISENHPLRENLRQILSAGLRARSLVGQILTFSRQSEVEIGPVMPAPLVKEAVKMLRASLPSTIRVKHHIQSPMDTVKADATQLYQVIMNLATNAADALKDMSGTLEFRVERVDVTPETPELSVHLPPGNYVRLVVKDTGIGMDRATRDRIFEPFFTTKPKGKGTGLGLSVVYGIVKSHKGAILVDSEPGKGSSFQVYFPRIREKGSLRKEGFLDIRGGTEHILFVDDEAMVADAAQKLLQKLGYQVTMRTSSVDALEAFRAEPARYDLVISDVTMPNMTGPELTRQILNIRPGMPIILCTGFSELIDEEKIKVLGIRAFMMKPVTYRDLAGTVRRVLDAG